MMVNGNYFLIEHVAYFILSAHRIQLLNIIYIKGQCDVLVNIKMIKISMTLL